MNNNNKIFNYVSIGVVILLIFALFSNKDSFKTIREETDDLYNDYYRNTTLAVYSIQCHVLEFNAFTNRTIIILQ